MDDASTERFYSSEEDSWQDGAAPETVRAAPHYRRVYEIPRRIHIMGIGSVGKFIAHSLKEAPRPPPISLITHKVETRSKWLRSDKMIHCKTDGQTVSRGGFKMQFARPNPRYHKQEMIPGMPLPPDSKTTAQQEGTFQVTPEEFAEREPRRESTPPGEWKKEAETAQPEEELQEYPEIDEEGRETQNSQNEMIWNLILTVKAPDVVSALSALQHRLDRNSTILFLHNGVGVIDEVNEHIFPDPTNRPSYLLGVTSHGVNSPSLWTVEHAGAGTIALGPYPTLSLTPSSTGHLPTPSRTTPSTRYLLRTIARIPVLTAAIFPPESLLAIQLEKLAINSVINPLTALLDIRNGALPHAYPLLRTARLLLAETSLVLRSLPALAHLPNTANKFSPQRLEALWVGVAHKTRNNISSMCADVRIGRRTEVAYINGWVARMGERLGVTCVTNYAVCQMVYGKQLVVQWEKHADLPLFEGVGLEAVDAETSGVVSTKGVEELMKVVGEEEEGGEGKGAEGGMVEKEKEYEQSHFGGL